MDILYFLISLPFGLFALNLWRPIFAPAGIATASFLAGLLANLFALHLFIICVAILLLRLVFADDGGVISSLGSVIFSASALAFLIFHLRGYNVSEAVEVALKQGLGDDYEADIAHTIRAKFARKVPLKTMLLPFPQDLPGVEVIKDISYGPHPLNKLDIYRAQGGMGSDEADVDGAHKEGLKPVLFQIHGGAWTEKMGSKNEQARPLMNHMALRDWVCVSVGYRLSPSATMPDHIQDVKQALLWVKAHIHEYGGDADFIVATGGSAGGHLSSLLALSANDPELDASLVSPHGADADANPSALDTSVQGCVPYYGAVDLLNDAQTHPHDGMITFLAKSVIKQSPQQAADVWELNSPMRRVHAQAPPFYVICGDADTLVPVGSNVAFATKLRQISKNDVCYAEIAGAQHAFDLTRTPHSEFVVHSIERWLGYQYSRYLDNT